MTVPKVRDERLCWLAVRDDLERAARRTTLLDFLIMVLSLGYAGDRVREAQSGRMTRFGIAVDQAAALLAPDERAHLRRTGQVPPWFRGEVRRRYRAARLVAR